MTETLPLMRTTLTNFPNSLPLLSPPTHRCLSSAQGIIGRLIVALRPVLDNEGSVLAKHDMSIASSEVEKQPTQSSSNPENVVRGGPLQFSGCCAGEGGGVTLKRIVDEAGRCR